MTKRVAVLMKLRNGVTKREVEELTALLLRIGDPQWMHTRNGVPKTSEDVVQRYDDKYSDPVFYCP